MSGRSSARLRIWRPANFGFDETPDSTSYRVQLVLNGLAFCCISVLH